MQIIKDVRINDEMTKRFLMYLNPVFAKAVNVSGVSNFHCEELAIPLAGEAKNDIKVVGTVSMNDVRLQASDLLGQLLSVMGSSSGNEVITVHPTRFVLADGFLRYDNMQIDVGNNPVNFKGVIGLDKSMDMTLTLPYTIEGRTARVGQDTAGERISLILEGTVDNPRLNTGKLLEDQLKQQLQKELERQLEKIFK